MIVFGGQAATQSNELFALSLDGPPAWTTLAATGPAPEPRVWHTAIYDEARDRMVVFGGGNNTHPSLNDVWALSLGTLEWTQLAPAGTPPTPRSRHTAIYDADMNRMIVFGGSDNGRFRNDTHFLTWGTPVGVGTLRSPARVQLAPPSPNPVRARPAFTWDMPAGRASLRIIDITGRTVATVVDEALPAGPHRRAWDLHGRSGEPVPPGVYLAELRVGTERATRRFIVLR